ncbi:TPA: hypothetical protein ACH3X3_001818 [Trebouxia sp. C0006]
MPAITSCNSFAYLFRSPILKACIFSLILLTCRTARASPSAEICVVIRTYWGHGGGSQAGLHKLMSSLQRQQNRKWEAVLVVLDSRPFPDLAQILQQLDDDRVWVFAEWIGPDFAARSGSQWVPTYHSMLYNLTDEAVRACPRSTKWVVITNGDNEYSSTLFEELDHHPDADVVALDYYSRYQRPTAKPCERFSAEPGKPACKQNLLRWCNTDLGANVLNWPRLIQENKRFSQLAPVACGLPAENYDGVLAQHLVDSNWTVHHVTDKCLYDHSPSPQSCARIKGVWDDSNNVWEGGGSCISQQEAAQKLLDDPAGLEQISLRLSSDDSLASFSPEGLPVSADIGCLRQKNVAVQHAQMMDYFGPTCTADADVESVKSIMSDKWQPVDWSSCMSNAHQLQEQHRLEHLRILAQIPPPPDPRDSKEPVYRQRYNQLAAAQPHDEL